MRKSPLTQTTFWELPESARRPPSTRYQGSKLKLLDWLWSQIESLPFDTALDAFGGTGSVAYLLKSHQKEVTYNDSCRFNHWVGRALIENSNVTLSSAEVDAIVTPQTGVSYQDFIRRTFSDIYFIDEENYWLDVACQNIHRLAEPLRQAVSFFALFQACIAKRPYNLFHRKNLYMRTAEVERSFGNKATWDTPFEEHFRAFCREANDAVFDSGRACRAQCGDAIQVDGNFDLVYIDTPYLNANGVGVDYFQFYHFLEGLAEYDSWPARIDWKRKHRPLVGPRSAWSDQKTCHLAFQQLFERYADSILIVSYRSDGIPSAEEIFDMLRRVKSNVRCVHYGDYKYVLSKNTESKELLFIAE